MTWTEYWNGQTTIYANARHKSVHYEKIAHDLIPFLPRPGGHVVDYGCGEALSAHVVADACAHLYLCESADKVRKRLSGRYAGGGNIEVISVDQFEALAPATIDMIVANSVIQYLSPSAFAHFLATCRAKLRPGGQLLLADVIPHDIGVIQDAVELVKFAAANGFLLAAGAGLVRSFFSNYRQLRQRLGLLQFDEAEILSLLDQAGFVARRCQRNLGHNSRRMTFLASARAFPSDA